MVTEQWLLLPMELLIREQTSQSCSPCKHPPPWPHADQQQLCGTQWATPPSASSPSVCSPAVSTEDMPVLPTEQKATLLYSWCNGRLPLCARFLGFLSWLPVAGSSSSLRPPCESFPEIQKEKGDLPGNLRGEGFSSLTDNLLVC